jgi:hypothetical protein
MNALAVRASNGATRFARACCLLALACCLLPARAEPAAGEPGEQNVGPFVHRVVGAPEQLVVPKCLTPAVGPILEDLVATGALQPVLQDRFTLERVDIRADQLELEIEDPIHHSYGITLALPEAKDGKPDGEGRSFRFYLLASPAPPNRDATTTLLAVATLFDRAIPDTALVRCFASDAAPNPRAGPTADRRYPRALALASASVEILVLLAAILFGLRAMRSRDRPVDTDS